MKRNEQIIAPVSGELQAPTVITATSSWLQQAVYDTAKSGTIDWDHIKLHMPRGMRKACGGLWRRLVVASEGDVWVAARAAICPHGVGCMDWNFRSAWYGYAGAYVATTKVVWGDRYPREEACVPYVRVRGLNMSAPTQATTKAMAIAELVRVHGGAL